MTLQNQRFRPVTVLWIAVLALTACSPPQQVFSLDPVDRRGAPLPWSAVEKICFETGEEIAAPCPLELSAGRLLCGDAQSWPLSSLDWIEVRDANGEQQRISVESPEDLVDFGKLPRIARVELLSGRVIDLEQSTEWTRWSEGRIGLEISNDGNEFELIPLGDMRTVQLYDGSLVSDTLTSWQFWLVAGGAVTIAWVLGSRSEDNLAVR